MKKLESFLFSSRSMGLLFILFAAAMAAGTFIEKYYDTATAKAVVYNASWFELIMLLLIINFIGNIKKYQLWKKDKWSVLMFHLAFVFMFIGAGITRYISYEGTMHIREGTTSNEVISAGTFLKMQVNNTKKALEYESSLDLSDVYKANAKWPIKKTFKKKYRFDEKLISIETLDYVPHAKDTLILNAYGKPILTVVLAGEMGRVNTYMESGDIKQINGTLFSFNSDQVGTVQFFSDGSKLLMYSPFEGEYMTMATQSTGKVYQDSLQEVKTRSLYQINGTRFVIPAYPQGGSIAYYEGGKDENLPDMVKLKVSSGKDSREIYVKGGKGRTNFDKNILLNGLNVVIGFGSKYYHTPFSVKLKDFVLERYSGSNSASSYASDITIIDEGKTKDYRIYMNHVLDYDGFRLFQSSYDPDEQGTILSVNHDLLGTMVTYIGYLMLFIGMFLTLFWKGTRFWQLNHELKKMAKKKNILIAVLFLNICPVFSQHRTNLPVFHEDSIKIKYPIDKEHAYNFSQLLVQDYQGRVKPINTMALEVLRKVYGKDEIYGLDANQWFIAIHADPVSWINAPIIKVGEKGGEKLYKLVKADKNGYTSMVNLIDFTQPNAPYILSDLQQKAFAKDPSTRTEFDKEVIKLDERFQILNGVPIGTYLRIIPIKNDLNNTWTSWITQNNEIDSTARSYFQKYFSAVGVGLRDKNWKKADYAVKAIDRYQQKWGEKINPSKEKVKLEVLYNQSNIFFKLMLAYTTLALCLLIFSFLALFSNKRWIQVVIKLLLGIVYMLVVLHALGLGARWYISGHAPWSNGYEAVVFISWVSVLAGLFMYKNRNAFIPTTGCFTAVIMMGFAHGGALLDPQITPLVPVLKSYWLIIHVAIITSSYGFFGLGFVLSIISLILFVIKRFSHNPEIKNSIKELSAVNEMTLIIGVFALTTGTFLGGMWANESWGRYWSWDPKETWAFISVMVYAFVLHMRFIPHLKSHLTFNIASLWAFSSIIFTYIGVNYFLSGLHSYAAGDPVIIPTWVYVSAVSLLLLCIAAWLSNKKHI